MSIFEYKMPIGQFCQKLYEQTDEPVDRVNKFEAHIKNFARLTGIDALDVKTFSEWMKEYELCIDTICMVSDQGNDSELMKCALSDFLVFEEENQLLELKFFQEHIEKLQIERPSEFPAEITQESWEKHLHAWRGLKLSNSHQTNS